MNTYVVQFSDKIDSLLKEQSESRGISVEDLIRYNIGSWARELNPFLNMRVIGAMPAPSPYPVVEDNADVYMKMSKYVFMNQVKDLAKCKNCNQPLDFNAFKTGECLKCGEKIKYDDEQSPKKEQD